MDKPTLSLNQFNMESDLDNISQEIKNMDKITGFKTLVTKYQDVQNKIIICQNKLINYQDELQNIETAENKLEDLDDNAFVNVTNELNKIKETISNSNLDIGELIVLYIKATKYITQCNAFLEKQKMEIINID